MEERQPLLQTKAGISQPKWKTTALIISAFLLVVTTACNISLITTTQSSIAVEFDSVDEIPWMISSYIVANTSMLPLAGRLGTIFSTSRCMLVAGFLFASGLLFSGLAGSISVFLLGRTLSGAAAGLFTSASLIYILQMAPTKHRGLFLGLQSLGFTTGVSLGGIIGGIFAERDDWRGAYLWQTPIVLAAAICVCVFSPSEREQPGEKTAAQSLQSKLKRVDYAGCFLLALSTYILLFTLSAPKLMLWPVLASIALYATFYWVERSFAKEPVIPIDLLSYRPLLFTCFTTMLQMAARWALLFNSPTYCLAVLALTPTQAGSALVPASLGFGLGGLLVGWLFIRKHESYYWSSISSLVVFALSYLVFDLLQPDSSLLWYIAAAFLNGLATGATLSFSFAHIVFMLDTKSVAIGTSLVATSRSLASTLSAALFGGAMQRSLRRLLVDGFRQHHEHLSKREYDLIRRIQGNPLSVRTLTGWQHTVAVEAYRGSIRRLIFLAGGVALLALLSQAMTGSKTRDLATPKDDKIDDRIDQTARL